MRKLYRIVVLTVVFLWPAGLMAQCCIFSYQQQVEPPTSAATFGVALGDLDGDSDMDAVAISAYYGVDVYFNNGSGTFSLAAHYATAPNPDFYGVHVVDIDNDNDSDIIAIPFYSSASLTLLLNNGTGVFTGYNVSSNIACYNAAVGDLDGDNDPDLFLPNSGGGSGKIYKNNGTGLYSLYQTLAGARGHDAELGDLDNDGDLDAFVVENSSYGNTVFLNDSTGNFILSGTPFGSNCTYVDLGDLDKDGDLDAWVGKFGNTCEIWLNNGTGSFSLHSSVSTGSYCKSVNLYDFDNDGDLDVFLGFYSASPQVWINGENLNFSLCYQAPVGSSCHGQAIGFINGDSYIDIYSGYFSNNDGDYVFLNASPSIQYTGSPYCPNNSTPQTVSLMGTPGGTFGVIPSGLGIDTASGTFTPSLGVPGNYFITYTTTGCTVAFPVAIKNLDTSVTATDSTLFANQDSATYVWADCNNSFQPVAGQTARFFKPAVSGTYALIVTYDGCTDTSSCYSLSVYNAVKDPDDTPRAVIIPNPASAEFTLFTEPGLTGQCYAIKDFTGRVIHRGLLAGSETRVDISHLPPAMYLICVGDENPRVLKFIRK
ncbi:MAG TPA: T9SS type A sorting domain-containing protein [Bacteroidales bacterium]|nr:T9SS type A sorting domain-containing protein [Bacteroidales bacterium]HRZ49794.1 T9SS type A sorting domain-containing protein [Bacteroidales bacterium]